MADSSDSTGRLVSVACGFGFGSAEEGFDSDAAAAFSAAEESFSVVLSASSFF